jgi:hypothetical protein
MVQQAEGHNLVMMVDQVVRHLGMQISCQGNLLKNNMVLNMSIPAASDHCDISLVGLTEVREFDRITNLSNFCCWNFLFHTLHNTNIIPCCYVQIWKNDNCKLCYFADD